MTKTIDTRFDFIGLWGCASHCRARLYSDASGVLVLLTERDDNDGTSVTNAIEELAMQLCDFYHLDGSATVWVEHYPDGRNERERAANCPDPIFEEHFSVVTFGHVERCSDGGWGLRLPNWAPLTVEKFEVLIGEKWTPETD